MPFVIKYLFQQYPYVAFQISFYLLSHSDSYKVSINTK